MRVEDCYQLGYVTKTHGLKGEIQIFLDVDIPQVYQDLESMFVLRNDLLVPFFVETIQINKDKALVKLDEVDTLDDAKALVSSEIYLPLSFLPKLEKGQYYYHEIIGFDFYDGKKLIGSVSNVLTNSAQELIAVDHSGTEILVPLNDQVIKYVNLEAKRVDADLPEGLLDIYLESDEN